MVDPVAPSFTPVWLSPASVKEWLRINDQDTDDDDLIRRCAAMAEPYVERCRPEFAVPLVVEAIVRLDPDYSSTQLVMRVDEWQSANPAVPLVDARGHIIALSSDIDDDWGVVNPSAPVQVLFRTEAGTVDVLPLSDDDGALIPARQAVAWLTQRRPLLLRADAVPPTTFVATDRVASYMPDAEAYQGGVMYAAREYRRRNSPAGVEMFGDSTSFVSRYDTDIERALHTGAWAPPVIA